MSNDPNTIFVGGINIKGDEMSLTQFFESNFGEVLSCKIIYDHFTQRSKGYGFVTFKEEEVAQSVIKSNNLFFMGKMMNVGPAVRRNVGKQPYNDVFQGPPPPGIMPQQYFNPYYPQPFYPLPYGQYPQMYPFPYPFPPPDVQNYYNQQQQNYTDTS